MAYATWNPADKSDRITLSGANLVATADGNVFNQAVRATLSKSTGKWYCELTCTTDGGLVGTVPTLGLANSTFDVGVGMSSGTQLGEDANGYGYRKNGVLRFNAAPVGGGSATWTTGDVISMLFDADGDTLTFWKNGTPIADTFTSVSGTFFPIFHDVGSSVITANFGATAFTYTPTAGYSGWSDTAVANITGDVAMEVAVGAAHSFILSEQPVSVAMEVAVSSPVEFRLSSQDASVAMEVAVAATVTSLTVNRDATVAMEVAVAAVVTSSLANVYSAGLSWAYGDTAGEVDDPYFVEGGFEYRFSLSGSMTSGEVWSAALTYPSYEMAASTPPAGTLQYVYTLEGQMTSGATWVGDLRVPARTADADLLNGAVFTGALTFPDWRVTSVVSVQSIYEAALLVRRWSVHGEALAGAYYTAALETLPYEISGVAFGEYLLTGAITWPSRIISAAVIAQGTDTFRTWALNLTNKALTEYDNFEFNSYAVFRGTAYSAGAEGVVPHTGEDDDNGVSIVALGRTGKEGFGTSYNKRLPRLYLVYKTLGDMKVSTFTSQDGQRVYLLAANAIAGVQTRRVPIGRGPKSPHWQIEFTNPNGEDFLVTSLQAYPERSRRRVV